MNQLECIQAVEEMIIPANKILMWANILNREYRFQPDQMDPKLDPKLNEAIQKLFDQLCEAAENLIALIPLTQEKIRTNQTRYRYKELFSHGIVGPMLILEGNSKMILTASSFRKRPEEQSPLERGQQLYLEKIHAASLYLLSLEYDAVMKIDLDRSNENKE